MAYLATAAEAKAFESANPGIVTHESLLLCVKSLRPKLVRVWLEPVDISPD
jgi:hypothetical protein